MRASSEWWWKAKTPNPASATVDDLEGVLLGLSGAEWRQLTGKGQPAAPHKDARGMLVTGNAMIDRLERELWETTARVE